MNEATTECEAATTSRAVVLEAIEMARALYRSAQQAHEKVAAISAMDALAQTLSAIEWSERNSN